jgi:hypothetical protein
MGGDGNEQVMDMERLKRKRDGFAAKYRTPSKTLSLTPCSHAKEGNPWHTLMVHLNSMQATQLEA